MIKLFSSFLLSMLAGLPAFTQSTITETKSRFTITEATRFLEHHNQVRLEVKIEPLAWDASIAAYSQEWADYLATKNNCKIAHRSWLKKEQLDYGENIYWVSSGEDFKPVDASEAWYSEKELFEQKGRRYVPSIGMGHYTQMIWKSTKRLGAGMAVCPSGAIIVVANYDPPGNYVGQNPF